MVENYPRAIVSIDVRTDESVRTVTITVPDIRDPVTIGDRVSPDGEERILDAMREALASFGAALPPGAAVILERVDGDLSWCRITAGGR